jgi:hypothetical protein
VEIEVVFEAHLLHPLSGPELFHGRAQSVVPEDGGHLGRGVKRDPLPLREVLEEAHPFQTVHVVAVHVRDQHIVDVEQRQLSPARQRRIAQHRAIGIGTVDG